MPRRSLPVLLFVVACNGGGGDDAAGTDARKPDGDPSEIDAPGTTAPTSCANPVPTTATDTVVISGTVSDGSFAGSSNPLAGATLSAFHTGGASLGTATTETGGSYQLTATTGGATIDYLQASDAGYKPMRFFPRVAIARATSVPKFPMFTTADAAAFPATFGVTQDGGKGMAIVYIASCQSSPIANATVTVTPPGSAVIKYLHADNSTTGTSTDSSGLAIVFNLGTGNTTINALVGSTELHAHVITGDPSYLTLAAISEQ
jgi:hypothetical protein